MNHLARLLSVLLSVNTAVHGAEQPIQMETPSGTISGTLTLPSQRAKVPVVLMIAGSGPTDRDGNTPLVTGKNDSLKLFAAALRDNGIASVRYDKRGIAASAGAARTESDVRFEDFVQDAASWVLKLSQDSRFTGVVVLGHSEGSLVGVLASLRSPAKVFVSVAGSADRASVVLRRQLQGRLPPELAAHSEAILRALEAGHVVSEVPLSLMPLYRLSVQPYLISWFRYSPAEEIAKLRIPCLLLQGGTDIQVTVVDAEKLHAANRKCQLEVLPSMNHVMKTVSADAQKQIASYGDPTLPLDTGLMRALKLFFSSDSVQSALRMPR